VQLGLHVPDAQAVVPCALVHASPQAPQLTFVSSGASHPFETFRSQSPKFALHVTPHAPCTQLAVPLLLLHTFPHAPQLFALVRVLTSQPLEPVPSQLPKPGEQVPSVQVPPGHVSLAFARSHTAPHVPQSVKVLRLCSHPFAATPSQLPYPGLQAWSWQPPLKQEPWAFVYVQAWPQEPQFAALAFRFVSQPFATLPSQSPKPGSQPIWQLPPLHTGAPFEALQACPHVPQLSGSSDVVISQPVP
jgi:hypothetical protein